MSASCDLTTLDAVKRHLGLSGSESDTLLGELIDAASEAIERYCGREFDEVERTEYHDGGSAAVVLRARPVSTVASVHDDPARGFSDGSLVDPGRYVVDGLAGIVELETGRFSRGIRSVKVVYTGGYSSVPDDVGRSCVLLVAHWFSQAMRLATDSDGEYDARHETRGWPSAVKGLLWPYREVGI